MVPGYDLVVVLTAATIDPSLRPDVFLQRWILPSLGVSYSTNNPLHVHPVLFLVGASPIVVMAVVFAMNGAGLWREETEREAKAE